MDRKQFGKLIAALRREQRDEHDHEYTQAKLAEVVGVSEQIIGKIERGEKVTYEADLLINLARAFRLSSPERQEFFLAAVGLDEKDIPHPAKTPEQILTNFITVLQTVALPAMIVDAYDDVIAANPSVLALFDPSGDMQKEAPRLVGGYNLMRAVFSKKSPYREALAKKEREHHITQNLQFFKTISLPHRASPYFQYLLRGFKKDKEMSLFNAYYVESTNGANADLYMEDEVLDLSHEKLGQIRCYWTTTTALTSVGNLYLFTYIPADLPTSHLFSRLTETCGAGAIRLASWPQKPGPWEAVICKTPDMSLSTGNG